MALRGVILYRVQSFLSPRMNLNFRHLSSCDTIEAPTHDTRKVLLTTHDPVAQQFLCDHSSQIFSLEMNQQPFSN